jgi:outer membrane protein assembly factor BamA
VTCGTASEPGFVLPFGALRFDWAEAVNAQINDETTLWHFSFGYAF